MRPLSERLRRSFPPADQERGKRYAWDGRVKLVARSDLRLEARVRGGESEPYVVVIDGRYADDGVLEVTCTCPRYASALVCKHLWATLLLADIDGFGQAVPGDGDLDLEDLVGTDLGAPAASAGLAPRSARPEWRSRLQGIGEASQARGHGDALIRRREIYYAIDLRTGLSRGTVTLALFQREETAAGDLGAVKRLSVRGEQIPEMPAPHDELLRALEGLAEAARSRWDARYWPPGSAIREVEVPPGLQDVVLERVAATGALLLWEGGNHRPDPAAPLVWDDGPPYRLALELADAVDDAPARITGELCRDDERVPVGAPRLLLAAGLAIFTDRVARLDARAEFPWIAALRRDGAIEIPAGELPEAVAELLALPVPPPIAIPERLAPRRERVPVEPRIELRRSERWEQPAGLRGRLAFRYGRVDLLPRDRQETIPDGGRLIERDREAERNATAVLERLGFVPTPYEPSSHVALSGGRLLPTLRSLLAAGWHVEVAGAPVRRPGRTALSLTTGIDWLEISGGVELGDVEVPLPALLRAARGGERLVTLDDGSLVMLTDEWLARYLPLARLAHGERGGVLRYASSQSALLDVLLAELPEIDVDAAFGLVRERLASFRGFRPAPEPRGFQGELRPYQREGLGWMRGLLELGMGGCLADDMGLGKTIQVLALLQWRRARPVSRDEKRPSIAVMPRSLVFNWIREAERFAPRLRVLDYSGPDREALRDAIAEHDLVITTYDTLRRDVAHLAGIRFDVAVLDEAQAIKNPASQRAKACRLLAADHRFVLTGTPVENHLGDLWSLFEFLNPGLLGRLGATGLQSGAGKATTDEIESLGRALAPFILRRTKGQVVRDLPEKTEQVLLCDLPAAQRRHYDELRRHFRAEIGGEVARRGLARSKIHVLEALLRLRQAACHPALVDPQRGDEPSAKLDLLLERLAEVVEEGNKALVFSQFTSLLALVRPRLDAAGIAYESLDGRTRDRQARVERFQGESGPPVFLISLKAGGVGLNLTAAGYVFLLDPWWNPAVEAQAIDRTHRIGQTQPVFAYRLIARDTVEEKILELQARKRQLAESLFTGEESLLRTLTAEDLDILLG